MLLDHNRPLRAAWLQASGLALLLGACLASPERDFYALLEAEATEPATRLAIAAIVGDDLHPSGRGFAEAHRADDDAAVRALCYVWLLRAGNDDGVDWLSQGLRDSTVHVRATCLVYAGSVERWTEAASAAMWEIAETCELGHVFDKATTRLVERGGEAAALRVHAIVQERGAAWGPYAVRALALHPRDRFRDVFEAALASNSDEHVLLGRRAFDALDGRRPIDRVPPAAWTTDEYLAHWRCDGLRQETPDVLSVAALLQQLRDERVVVLGELHSWLPLLAWQVMILAELYFAHGSDLVLVCEQPVRTYQAPLIEAAKLYQIEVAFLEDEVLGATGSPAERDDIVRGRLVERVLAEPSRVFLVCYGENHRRSFHAALREAGVPAASVSLHGSNGMAGAAMRLTLGQPTGLAFRYSDNSYYLPAGSVSTRYGSTELNELFLRRR